MLIVFVVPTLKLATSLARREHSAVDVAVRGASANSVDDATHLAGSDALS